METIILCPTRGRPSEAREAYRSFGDTKVLPGTEMTFVVDDDDPTLNQYSDVPHYVVPSPGNMVRALNIAAAELLEDASPRYIGFVGDDHRFRTHGWDRIFVTVLESRNGGMVYANDGFRHDIPTQIVMSSEIVGALGWMGLPTCHHLYIDNAWMLIGERLKFLYYMPDVLIEHMHPVAGKAGWDEGHRRVNSGAMYDHDGRAFNEWAQTMAAHDVEQVKAAMGR